MEQYGTAPDSFIISLADNMIKNPSHCYRVDIDTEMYVDNNQEDLGDAVSTFFNDYSELGKLGNEQWLYKRVNAVFAHLNKKVDLFAQKEEIRRSIIFCCKSSNDHFVIALNNKLSKNRL